MPGDDMADTEWREFRSSIVECVVWTSEHRPGAQRARSGHSTVTNIAHNGLEIGEPAAAASADGVAGYGWRSGELDETVARPYLTVFDAQHRLGLTLTRYELLEPVLPFEHELSRSIGLDVLAHALVCGAARHPLAVRAGLVPVRRADGWFPLSQSFCDLYMPAGACLVLLSQTGNAASRAPTRELAESLRRDGAGGLPMFVVVRGARPDQHGHAADVSRASRCVVPDRVRHPKAWKAGAIVSGMVEAMNSDVRRSQLANAPHVRQSNASVSVMVFVRDRVPAATHEPLAAVWHEIAGGPIPLDRNACDLLSNRYPEAHPGLRPHLAAWRRRQERASRATPGQTVEPGELEA